MQAINARTASCAGAGFSGRAVPVASCPARRRNSPRSSTQVCSSSYEAIAAVSQIATTCAVAAGAFMLLREQSMAPEQDHHRSEQRPCPSCQGTGYESCMCSKWSDGDVGCNSCSKTGYMRCRSCGGGGTAIPLLVKVRK